MDHTDKPDRQCLLSKRFKRCATYHRNFSLHVPRASASAPLRSVAKYWPLRFCPAFRGCKLFERLRQGHCYRVLLTAVARSHEPRFPAFSWRHPPHSSATEHKRIRTLDIDTAAPPRPRIQILCVSLNRGYPVRYHSSVPNPARRAITVHRCGDAFTPWGAKRQRRPTKVQAIHLRTGAPPTIGITPRDGDEAANSGGLAVLLHAVVVTFGLVIRLVVVLMHMLGELHLGLRNRQHLGALLLIVKVLSLLKASSRLSLICLALTHHVTPPPIF